MQAIPDLSGLSDIEFEAARCRIIADHLSSLPKEQAYKMRVFQMNLDVQRAKLQDQYGMKEGGVRFMHDCFKGIGENLENLSDAYVSLGHELGVLKPALPDYANERVTKT